MAVLQKDLKALQKEIKALEKKMDKLLAAAEVGAKPKVAKKVKAKPAPKIAAKKAPAKKEGRPADGNRSDVEDYQKLEERGRYQNSD